MITIYRILWDKIKNLFVDKDKDHQAKDKES
jgi:hypothetical protein